MNTGTGSSSQHHLGALLARWLFFTLLLGLAIALSMVLVTDTPFTSDRVVGAAAIAAAGGVLGSLLLNPRRASTAYTPAGTPGDEVTLLDEAQRLRTMRERARAIYEMAITLSGTLDHRRVMEVAQNIGSLSLREDIGTNARLVSAVLLFQGPDKKLRVVTSRGLTPTDKNVALQGQRGVLGLALKQAQPVFGGSVISDPELRYFAAFQDAKSVLAIPLGAGFDLYGVIVFGCDKVNAFSDEHVELMTAIGTQSTLSLQNAVLYQNLLNEKEKIVEVEEHARKKLARDLHDGPTQSVAAIAMRANYIRRLIERQPQQAVEELWKVEDLARRTTKEIRHMLFTMRPLVLENQGLVAALNQLAEKMLDTHDTHMQVQATTEVETYLDTNALGVLFYIIEEAVNNARKHANSEKIWVRLYLKDSFVIVEIEDHGVGFNIEAVDENYDQRGSLGMINMRERAGLIEGQLRIQSAEGKGTKISVLVPVDTTGIAGSQFDAVPPLQLQSHREITPNTVNSAITSSRPSRPSRPSKPQPKSPVKRPITHIPGARPTSAPSPDGTAAGTGPLQHTPTSKHRQPAPHRRPARPRTPARVPSGIFESVHSEKQDEVKPDKKPANIPETRPITKRLKPPTTGEHDRAQNDPNTSGEAPASPSKNVPD